MSSYMQNSQGSSSHYASSTGYGQGYHSQSNGRGYGSAGYSDPGPSYGQGYSQSYASNPSSSATTSRSAVASSYVWVPDEAVTRCPTCYTEFTAITSPKHHCRKCGQIFCHGCSKYKALIPREEAVKRPAGLHFPSLIMSEDDIMTAPQRLCLPCYESVKDRQEELQLMMSPSYQKSVEAGTIVSLPAIHFRLEDEIEKAMALLQLSKGKHDPANFESCYGLVFLTILKGGMVFTGKYGTGFVVSRLNADRILSNSNSNRYASSAEEAPGMTGWSAPSAVTMLGMGWGFQIGAEVQHVCFILPNKTTVEAFRSSGQFTLGGEISLALGMGMSVEAGGAASTRGVAYGHGLGVTQGLFFGTSIEATCIGARKDVNRAFYGQRVTPSQLLSGSIPRPPAVEPLNRLIEEFLAS
jgi:SH3 domain-containing YSC84-like protein 1